MSESNFLKKGRLKTQGVFWNIPILDSPCGCLQAMSSKINNALNMKTADQWIPSDFF